MTQLEPPGSKLIPIYLKLPPEHIVTLKFIIESYEGIAELRTLNSDSGEVVILAIEDTIAVTTEMIATLEETLKVREIPPPESLAGDWLLAEELKAD